MPKPAMPELILALDVGTTTTTALLSEAGGLVLATASRPIPTSHPGPLRAEQDPEAVLTATLDAAREALSKAGRRPADLAAVGVTSQRASLVVWDRRTGAAAGPMVLWNDLSGSARAAEMAAAGLFSWPQMPSCKLEAALAAAGPGDWLWGGMESFLVWRLSGGGAHVTDLSNAWLSGYYNFVGGWNEPVLAWQGLSETMFPTIVDSVGPMATCDTRVFGAATPITALIGDQQAGFFAHGGVAAGTWKATFGTSGVIIASTGEAPNSPMPTLPPEALAGISGKAFFCVEGMIITAGAAIDWVAQGLGLFPTTGALLDAAAAAPDSGGAAFRPSLQGLGAPHADMDAAGLIAGLHPGVGSGHLARAAVDGVAFRAREIAEAMRPLIGEETTLGVDGGLTASPIFLQSLADALSRPVRRHVVREATAYGAAMAAGLGAGLLDDAALAERATYEGLVEPGIGADEAEARYKAWAGKVF
jgi:glycerol kinase